MDTSFNYQRFLDLFSLTLVGHCFATEETIDHYPLEGKPDFSSLAHREKYNYTTVKICCRIVLAEDTNNFRNEDRFDKMALLC